MTRNYGLKPKDKAQGLRCKRQFHMDLLLFVRNGAAVLTVITLIVLLYALMGSLDAQAVEVDARAVEVGKLDHTEKLLVSYMNHGAVEDATTIYTCANKTYEMPKGI